MSTAKQKEVIKVNTQDLMRVLAQVKGAKPATILTSTKVEMNKTGNPYHNRITKQAEANIFLNYNYEKAVNARLVKEGKEPNFVASAPAWGESIPGTPLVLHKGSLYLTVGYLTNNTPKSEYFCDGEPIAKVEIENYLKPKSSSAAKQGLEAEDEVVVRKFKLESIKEIRMGGKIYEIIAD